jgi:alginate O-acetyltransferase complex protein AlgI
MLFNSAQFVLFFLFVYPMFFVLGKWAPLLQWPFILIASAAFYMAAVPHYILILVLIILIDYFAGLIIAQSTGRKRQAALLVSILSNCAILFFFKYVSFFVAEILQPLGLTQLPQTFGWELPIGLSFHTFQSLSYIIEVYRGNTSAERRLDRYALYVLFFPQLVAGPIERPQNLLFQFSKNVKFNEEAFRFGAQLVLWGAFKKIVVADRLAYLVDAVYKNYTSAGALTLAIATIAFAFQIYCDFSGYSDIARGIAKMLGIDLMINFERPYFSSSVREFWRRWHISLSTWFRDYVYYPLGGSRGTFSRHSTNLLITFCVSGLWHGANWTYIAWGAINGMFLILEMAGSKLLSRYASFGALLGKVPTFVFQGFTFVAICLTWVFFRSDSVAQAAFILDKIVTGTWYFEILELRAPLFTELDLVLAALSVLSLLLIERWFGNCKEPSIAISTMGRFSRYCFYIGLTLAIVLLGTFDSKSFIYFQF